MTADEQQRSPITAERFKDLRFPGDLDLSADGTRVAFEVGESPPGQNTRLTRIWTVGTVESADSAKARHYP